MRPPPRILAIAGSDSSGGAGIQADIKTITMLGGYAMTAVTALTAQNTLGVARVDPVDPAMVAAQIEACVSDIGLDAVKIGMLGSAATAHAVADRLEAIAAPIVFDPVMVATSGAALADAETIAAFERLMTLATLTTPNLAELAALGGDAAMAARTATYLAKGGDADGSVAVDRLIRSDGSELRFEGSRIATPRQNVEHGGGEVDAAHVGLAMRTQATPRTTSPPL